MGDPPELTWAEQHQRELDQRAAEKRAEKEARREANRAAWADREAAFADQRAASMEEGRHRKASNVGRWAARGDPAHDPHTMAMAAAWRHTERDVMEGYSVGDVGCTPQEWLDEMARRRSRMRLLPPISEQMKTVPVIGGSPRDDD